MDAKTFRRILTTLADTPADFDLQKGTLVAQNREEMISATVSQRDGDLIVCENDEQMNAAKWLVQRVARLPLLADRILSHIPEETTFVSPDGSILDQIDAA